MDFESVVTKTLGMMYSVISFDLFNYTGDFNGRNGSSNAEIVIKKLINNHIKKINKKAKNISKNSQYKFLKISTLSANQKTNPEAQRRSLSDLNIIFSYNNTEIKAFINIKATIGDTPDNTTSWFTLGYIIFGSIDLTRRGAFLEHNGTFAEDEHFNYFYWTFFKNKSQTQLIGSIAHSMLQIPIRFLTFNINQSTPIQIKHNLLRKNESEIINYVLNPLEERRIALYGWLLDNLYNKYTEYINMIKSAKRNYNI